MEEQWQREMEVRWDAHKREHALEMQAILVARESIDRRLTEMNELRSQINSERGEFMTRAMFDAKFEALAAKIEVAADTLDARLNSLENARSNFEGRIWAVGAIFAGSIVLIQVGLSILKLT